MAIVFFSEYSLFLLLKTEQNSHFSGQQQTQKNPLAYFSIPKVQKTKDQAKAWHSLRVVPMARLLGIGRQVLGSQSKIDKRKVESKKKPERSNNNYTI